MKLNFYLKSMYSFIICVIIKVKIFQNKLKYGRYLIISAQLFFISFFSFTFKTSANLKQLKILI